ncbi:J domain-containing protein [Variovorax sp. RT4R15]|uniref:J domain-containing protein n=1 Tax=Variovorax sp. RT4R15 TaxID=3443737 RepID=UPI003F457046
MNFLEAFAYLGLESGADRRSIQRAYAAAVKAIDQETEPERFAHIREAYEIALPWAGTVFDLGPASPIAFSSADADALGEKASGKVDDETKSDGEDAALDHEFEPQPREPLQSLQPNPIPVLEPLDDLEQRASFASDDVDSAQVALEAVLAGDALVALGPRAFFEEQLALALQQRRFGAHNGVLLTVAARHFGWMDATSGRRLPLLLQHHWVLALDELATMSPALLRELLKLAGEPDPFVLLEWVDRVANVDRSHPLIAMILPAKQAGTADHLQRWRQLAKRPPFHHQLWKALTAPGYAPGIFRGALLIVVLIGVLLTVGTRIEQKEQVRAVSACDGVFTQLRLGPGRWEHAKLRQMMFCVINAPPADCPTRGALLEVARTVRQLNPDGANWELVPDGLVISPNRSPVYEMSTSSACASILDFAERWNWLGMGDLEAARAFTHVVAKCANTPEARRHPALIKLLASTDGWPQQHIDSKSNNIEAAASAPRTSLQSLVTPTPTVDPMAVFKLSKPWPACTPTQ